MSGLRIAETVAEDAVEVLALVADDRTTCDDLERLRLRAGALADELATAPEVTP